MMDYDNRKAAFNRLLQQGKAASIAAKDDATQAVAVGVIVAAMVALLNGKEK